MSRQSNVAEVYEWIVDDVVTKIQSVFSEEGIDSSIPLELRELWFGRLKESGVMGNNSVNDDSDLREEFTTTPNLSNPRYPSIHTESNSRVAIGLPTGHDRSFPRQYIHGDTTGWIRSTQIHHYHHPNPSVMHPRFRGVVDSPMITNRLINGQSRPNSIHIVPSDSTFHLHQHPRLTTAVSTQVTLRKRKGPEDEAPASSHSVAPAVRRKSGDKASLIPQRDGADEDPSISVDNQQEADLETDSALSDDEEEEPAEWQNCLTAQYDKVNRIKNRWKCQMRHGIFHIDGRDYLFKSATGEFNF